MMIRRRAAYTLALVTFGYLLAARVMLAPICNFSALTTASFGGDARLIIWTLAWDNHALLDREPSLFDANIFYPFPEALAYSEHLYGISLFTLPLYAATRNPVLAYNVIWIASFLLMAGAAHWLAWRMTNDHLAAMVAGLLAAFCFYRMHQGHGHLHMIWSFWIPISLVATARWVDRRTWRALVTLAVLIVLQALGSWYQAVLIVVANGSLFLWLLGVTKEARSTVALRQLAVQTMAGAAIVFVAIWPFARHYQTLMPSTPGAVAANVADLAGYLVPPQNTIVGRWLMHLGAHGPRWIWGETTLFLGWIPLLLAVAGAVIAWSRGGERIRFARYFVVLAVLAVALAVGPSPFEIASGTWGWTPFGLLMHVPGVDLFRVPARFTELLTIAIAMLAAVAAAWMHARLGWRGRATTIVLTIAALVEFRVADFPGGPPAPFRIPKVYRYLTKAPRGAVVSLPDFADTEIWFEEPDYQYFSTVHWLPIANGYSRAEPAGFRPLMDRLQQFPLPDAIASLRAARIAYVVLHGKEYRDRAPQVLAAAIASHDVRLLAGADDVYLFAVQ